MLAIIHASTLPKQNAHTQQISSPQKVCRVFQEGADDIDLNRPFDAMGCCRLVAD